MKNASEKLKEVYINLFAKPYFLFLFSFFVLVLLYFIRGFVLHGQESYFYQRISYFILENNIPNYDFLSFGGRAFLYPMGSFLFIVLTRLISGISVDSFLIFIPIMLGIFSLMLFYYILKYFKITDNTIAFASYTLILSPAFLHSFTHFTSFTIPLFLNILGFFFIINEKKIFYYLAFFIYFILTFFGFIHIFFGICLLLFYFYKKNSLKKFIPYSIIILFMVYLNNHFISFGLDVFNDKFFEYLSLFGGSYGLSVFLLFLSFFGFMWFWKDKYKNLFYYLFILLSLFILILNVKYLIYFNIILCVLGSFGLKYIYKLKWSSLLIRNLTIILLIFGVLFSGFSFIIENSKQDPSKELYDSLIFLEKKTDTRDVILSHEKYGIYINSVSKRKNFADINKEYAPRANLRFHYLNNLYYSKDLTNLLRIFEEFKVSHVLITPEMKNGLVWNRNNEGLLYLLNRNPNYFERIYNENGYEVWRVI